MLAFLSSMSFESEQILSRMSNVRSREIAGNTVCYGTLEGVEALLVHAGLGRVNAAHAATCAIENFPVSRIINCGVGGAYPGSGLRIGDIAVATKEISGDEGVIDADGWGPLKKIGIPVVQAGGRKYFNDFPLDSNLLNNALDLIAHHASQIAGVKSGSFVTVSAATGTQKRAKELEKRFGAVCENMEGSAIAHVSTIYKIPMLEIRGISNVVGIRDKRKWNLRQASDNCQAVLLEIVGRL